MSITFSVIDLNCEAADQSFFVPQIQLSPKSTSTFATVLGYSEFGTPSSPPKKYRTITITGFSKRTAVTAEQVPRQCAGAQYIYSGVGQIDLKGNQLSNYRKDFFAQCAKQYWPLEPLQINPIAQSTGGQFPTLVGYCWPNDPNSCPTCDPIEANWSSLGNQASNIPIVDLGAFRASSALAPVVTKTSWTLNEVFSALLMLNQNAPYSFVPSGVTYNVTIGGNTVQAETGFTNPGNLTFPVEQIGGIAAEYLVYTDTNNYSAVLTDEYTDAEALANSTVVVGTSPTAQNAPRTTGFTSVTTNVVFTLLCTNLISGSDYLVTVDLWDKPSNTHTPKSYGFTASSDTHSITDVVPAPAAGHTKTVRNPTIVFSP